MDNPYDNGDKTITYVDADCYGISRVFPKGIRKPGLGSLWQIKHVLICLIRYTLCCYNLQPLFTVRLAFLRAGGSSGRSSPEISVFQSGPNFTRASVTGLRIPS